MTAAVVAGCSQSADVSSRIAAEAAKAQTIDLAALTPFAWDRALVFGPYASTDRICAALPKSFAECAKSYPQGVGEGSYLLTFIRDSRVVHHELHSRRHGEFCKNSCVLELSPETARFTVGVSSSVPDRKHFSPATR
ncbi:hypothetical protein [Roseateles sp. LYH14W]|uniref:Lipoprotein n=1 Tax=Pelomonas parva TaxID=3299032 RepID=A0ABW7EYF0_9BURK